MDAEKAGLLTVTRIFAKLPYEQVLVEAKRRFFAAAAFFESINVRREEAVAAWVKAYWPRQLLPMHLTAFRIAAGILLAFQLLLADNDRTWFIIVLFFAALMAGFVGGPLARVRHQETPFAELMDLAADRLLIIPVAVYTLFGLHYWLALWIVIFEAVNMLVSTRPDETQPIVKSNIFAKIKISLQAVALLGILIWWPYTPHLAFVLLLWVSAIALVVSIFIKIKDAA